MILLLNTQTSWEQKRFYKATCNLNFGGCSNRNGQTKKKKKSCKEKYSMKSCIYLSSSHERPKQTKKKANFYFLNCSEFPTSLCHNIVPFFSIFFVMLTKLGPFQGHHLFLKEKYSMKSYSYLWISTPSTVADPGFSPSWGMNPPSVKVKTQRRDESSVSHCMMYQFELKHATAHLFYPIKFTMESNPI